jgi:TolA-binding protein
MLLEPVRPWLSGPRLLMIVALLASCPVPLRAEDKDDKLYQGLLRSSVWVHVVKKMDDSKTEYIEGTGVLLEGDRHLIVTNNHVVRDKDQASVLFPVHTGGKLVTDKAFYRPLVSKASLVGRVVALDAQHDLALIDLPELPSGVAGARLADESIKVGEGMHSLGNPGDSDKMWQLRNGTVQRIRQHKTRMKTLDGFESEIDTLAIFTNTPTKPGESGGPLINDKGELVGITTGHATEKVGDKETQYGVYIELSELKALLKSEKMLAKGPAAAKSPERKERPNPFADSPKGKPKSAEGAPTKSKDDPEEMEQTAARRLKTAKSLIEDGLPNKAAERLRELLKKFPNTKAAEEAKTLLDKLEP